MHGILFFIIPFLAAFVIFRGIIFLISKPLSEIAMHTREGAKFHHLHFGIIILFIGFVLLLTFGTLPIISSVLGFGFGMVVDEFIPSLFLPEPEPFTSKLYGKSFTKTALLFAAISLIILIATLWQT